MSIVGRVGLNTRAFIVDYCQRHKHPLNAGLHLFGVPMVFFGITKLCMGKTTFGLSLFALGYLLQYLGHRAQGNEVGELILVKKLWLKLKDKNKVQGEESDTHNG